jgi:hypothetical protein
LRASILASNCTALTPSTVTGATKGVTDQLLRDVHASNISLRSSIFGAALTIAAAILLGSWML